MQVLWDVKAEGLASVFSALVIQRESMVSCFLSYRRLVNSGFQLQVNI